VLNAIYFIFGAPKSRLGGPNHLAPALILPSCMLEKDQKAAPHNFSSV